MTTTPERGRWQRHMAPDPPSIFHGRRLSPTDEDAYTQYVAICAETNVTPMSRFQWMAAGCATERTVEDL